MIVKSADERCEAEASLPDLVRDFGAKLNPWTLRTLARRSVFGRPEADAPRRSLLVRLAHAGRADEAAWLQDMGREVRRQAPSQGILSVDQPEGTDDLLSLLRQDRVESVTVPRPVRPMLQASPAKAAKPKGLRGFTDIRCEPKDLGTAAALDGASVVIGILDYGCDVRHPALRQGADGTRLVALWDQNAPARPMVLNQGGFRPFDLTYGASYSADEIRSWLAGAAPYDPHANYFEGQPSWGAHGTYVASIAAGSRIEAVQVATTRDGADPGLQPSALSFQGVAPGAPLIFVQLGITDQDWVGNLRGAPTFRQYSDIEKLTDGIEYVYAKALDLRAAGQQVDGVVINLSVGTWGGAHDGLSTAEMAIDDLVREVNARPELPSLSVVIGAGNAGHIWNHDSRRLEEGQSATISWRMMRGDTTPNELEIWYRGEAPDALAEVEIAPPGADLDDPGAMRFALPAGEDVVFLTVGEKTAGFAIHQLGRNGRPNHIDIMVDPQACPECGVADAPWASGAWTIRIKPPPGSGRTTIHSWIERDDADDAMISSYQGLIYRLDPFDPVSGPRSTLSSLSCGRETIVVGGYTQARIAPNRTEAWFGTSHGPAPWDRTDWDKMPDLSAPAHNVLGAASGTSGFFAQSGTSAAAPHVAGAVALYLQKAARDGWRPATEDVRTALIDAARARRQMIMTNWPSGQDWDPQRGFGPLDVAGLLAQGRPAS